MEDNEDLYTIYLAKMETLLLDKSIIMPLDLYSTYTISKVANINEITCGIKETLKKRFGGLRLLFGQVIPK